MPPHEGNKEVRHGVAETLRTQSILDHAARERRQGVPGIKAIIIYPMKALAEAFRAKAGEPTSKLQPKSAAKK